MTEYMWGNNPAKGRTRESYLRGARLYSQPTVAEAYPLLKDKVGQWVSHWRGQHCERVKLRDSVTIIDGAAWVRVERNPPLTGGLLPAVQLVTALAVIPQAKTRRSGRVLEVPAVIYL